MIYILNYVLFQTLPILTTIFLYSTYLQFYIEQFAHIKVHFLKLFYIHDQNLALNTKYHYQSVPSYYFLKKYNFIDSNSKLKLNYVDYSGYKKIVSSEDTNILVIGQTTCGYCIKAKPILNQIAIDKNIKINYLNITKLSDEEKNKFTKYLDYFSENTEWGTPLTLIVKNGKVVDSANGLLDYDGYVSLFEKNGMVK